MKNKNGLSSLRLAPRAAGFALATVLPFAVSTASAFELNFGAVTGSLDTTVSYGTGWRLEDPDVRLSGTYPSYTAAVLDNRRTFINKNDGNANFDNNSRPFTSVFKITTDLELKYENFGLFTRGTAFYDTVIMGDNYNRSAPNLFPNSASCNPQTSATPQNCGFPKEILDHSGHDLRFLDAYVYGNFDIGGKPLNVRAGSQVISWGEALFLQDGINSANPVSLSKLRLPGAEVKEALLPLPMLSASLGLTDSLTAEAFYIFDWDNSEADDAGTYYSTDDAFAGLGSNRILVDTTGSPLGAPNVALGNASIAQVYNTLSGNQATNILTASRGADVPTDGKGQFGLALRYSLDSTELGFYFMNYHSHKPVAQATTGQTNGATTDPALCAALTTMALGTPSACDPVAVAGLGAAAVGGFNAAHYINTTTYQLVYPEDIQMYGVSFSTTLGDLSVSGELAYRPKDVILSELGDNLVAYNTLIAGTLGNGGSATAGDILNDGNPISANQTVKVWEELETWNLDLVGIYNFGPTFGADGATGVLEFGASYVPKGEDKRYASTASLLYLPVSEVPGGSGNTACAAPKYDPASCLSEGPASAYLDRLSMGYRIALTSTYNDVFAGVALNPVLRFAHDFKGNSHRTGNFLENRKSATVGLNAIYNQALEVSAAYNVFWGEELSNLLADRDNVTLTVKYSF